MRESRQREEDCATLLKALDVKPGQVVCDMGCGNGFYTLQAGQAGGRARARCWPSTSNPKCCTCSTERAKAEESNNIEPIQGRSSIPSCPRAAST